MILSETRRDVLAELINVGLGHAAGLLHTMTDLPVRLEVPSVALLQPEEVKLGFSRRFGQQVMAVNLGFTGGFDGQAKFVLPSESAAVLVAALHGVAAEAGQTPELPDDAEVDADLQEIGNVVINSVLGAVANSLKQRLDFTPPTAARETVNDLVAKEFTGNGGQILVATSGFIIEHLQLNGSITLLFQVASVEKLMAALDEVSFGG